MSKKTMLMGEIIQMSISFKCDFYVVISNRLSSTFLAKKTVIFLSLVIFLFQIGGIYASDLSNDLKEKLEEHIKSWKDYAPLCEGYPSKEDCDDGDMTLFSGLLCIAGVEDGCNMVRDSQGSNGRWWRSPRRVDGKYSTKNITFSRDMSLGVMLYLVAEKDSDRAKAWLNWIKENRACMLDNPSSYGDPCLAYAPLYRLCKGDEGDFRCQITPNIWGLMTRVWTYLDLPLDDEMKGNEISDFEWQTLEATFSEGYQLHLKGVSALLYQVIERNNKITEKLTDTIIRKQPDNPFFMYLSNGSTKEVVDRLLEVCPTTKPDKMKQWSWERDTSSAAWKQRMGWDCIFMARLVLSNK